MASLKMEDFLYGLEWGEKIDTMFAEVLSDQALIGKYSVEGGDNSSAIEVAQYVINKSFKTNFDSKKCYRQANKLKKRHAVFSWLLSLNGFNYDENTKRTHASKEMWQSIVKVEPYAHAYEKQGDPAWEFLKVLFGTPPTVTPQPIPVSVHREIIDITSDGEEGAVKGNNATDFIEIDSSSGNTHGTTYWNNVAGYHDGSDSETSPSIKTESSTTNANNIHFGSPSHGMSSSVPGWSPWKKY